MKNKQGAVYSIVGLIAAMAVMCFIIFNNRSSENVTDINGTEAVTSVTETETKALVVKPTEAPTKAPVVKPTEAPTKAPVVKPTEAPTKAPVVKPTEAPTKAPAVKPTEAPTSAQVKEYKFKSAALLNSHFEKHGAEFPYSTKEEYVEGANRVVNSKEALHKLEAEDGDDVYYLEASNEFVILSKAGYIRTYFKPSAGIDYYNRQ